MTKQKFDESDRENVIKEIESCFGVKLSPVGTRKKYLKDQNRRTFWVFGGVEQWHGIPLEMMEAEERSNVDGVFVIAVRDQSRIIIYTGNLMPIIKGKKKLSQTKSGDYHFNICTRGDLLLIKELPGFYLSRLGTSAAPEETKKAIGHLLFIMGNRKRKYHFAFL